MGRTGEALEVQGKGKTKQVEIPVWEKLLLTIEETSIYSNISSDKIRQIIKEQDCDFVLCKGTHKLIKRKKFEKFIENSYVI